MTEKLLAWFGDPALKEEVILRLKEHRAKDQIVRGIYQQVLDENLAGPSGLFSEARLAKLEIAREVIQHNGCAIGCTLPPVSYERHKEPGFNWHSEVQRVYGIDEKVADLIDDTFEAQHSFQGAAKFAVEVIEAIPVGADLSGIDCRTRTTQSYGECGKCVCCRFNGEDARQARASAARLIKALKNAPVPE